MNIQDLKVGQVVYHDLLLKGTINDIKDETNSRGDTKKYLYIKYDSKKDVMRCDAIKTAQSLHLEPTLDIKLYLELLNDPTYIEINNSEKLHFEDIKKELLGRSKVVSDDVETNTYGLVDDKGAQESLDDIESARVKARKLSVAAKNPYFAKVEVNDEELYISRHHNEGNIIFWTDPRGKYFFEYNDYKDEISLARSFTIDDGNYYRFNDVYSNPRLIKELPQITDDVSNDELLQENNLIGTILKKRENGELHNIVETMSSEQYKINTVPVDKHLYVNGCAGSGKTELMFHRIKFVMDNSKLSIDDIHVVSPTALLANENQAYEGTLEIDGLKSLSTEEFYISLFKNYESKFTKTEDFNRAYLVSAVMARPDEIKKDELLSPELQKECYAPENIQSVILKIKEIGARLGNDLNSFIGEYQEYVSGEFIDFESRYNMPYEYLNGRGKDKLDEKLKNFYRARKEIQDVSPKEAKRILEILKARDNGVDYNALNYYLSSNKFYGKLDRENIGPGNISSLLKFLKDNGYGDFYNPIKMFSEYAFMRERERRFSSYCLDGNLIFISDAAQYLIRKFKIEKGIDLNHVYQWEMVWMLYALNSVHGPLNEKNQYLYLDECQNYANEEINLMFSIYPNLFMNLFGDRLQKTTNKDNRDVDDLFGKVFTRIEINKNYRNSLEITKLINEKFDLQIEPTNIHGSVQYADPNKVFDYEIDKNETFAIIIKSLEHLPDLYTEEQIESFSVVRSDKDRIKKGRINVVPVEYCNGLEFTRVCMVPKGMTRNESYVAATRGLYDLLIVSE